MKVLKKVEDCGLGTYGKDEEIANRFILEEYINKSISEMDFVSTK